MTKAISVNYTDTAISGVSSLPFSRGLVNFGADFRIKSDEPDEAILTNMTSPLNFPEKARVGFTEVADVYKGAGIDPSLYAPTKRGVSILSQITEVWTVTDSEDPTFQVALPVSAHIVLKIPNHELITPAMVTTLLGRAVSGLYDTGDLTTKRLAAMLRGSLLPSDL